MTIRELVNYTEDEEGRQGLRALPIRLERAWRYGHSAFGFGETLQDFIVANRAGPDESELTLKEIEERYRRPETGWRYV